MLVWLLAPGQIDLHYHSRLPPFVGVPHIGVANAFDQNRRVGVDFARAGYGLGLGWLYGVGPVGTRAADRVVALRTPLDV